MNYAAPSLDILATAVLMLDEEQRIRYINTAAENLFGVSSRQVIGHALGEVFHDCAELVRTLESALRENASFMEHAMEMHTGEHVMVLSVSVTPVEFHPGAVVVEFHPAGRSMKIAREEQTLAQAQAAQMLLRQLAHEIRNPLGGIRGAAQLLEAELQSAELVEYTQVIIQETGRLQDLLDRWLAPTRRPEIRRLNVHEVMERVRHLVMAEYPGIEIQREYDISLPDIQGDMEQLIQALLNIVRNGAQALGGQGSILLRTSVARQVTLAMKRWKLAARIDIIDYGPGIPEEMQDMIFFPLVSGREGGTGVGLTLAQSLIQRHEGVIHLISEPGFTCFSVYLPIQGAGDRNQDPAKAALQDRTN
jgi:two-component system nitrogen regulation sensor histidine kinase GlnL